MWGIMKPSIDAIDVESCVAGSGNDLVSKPLRAGWFAGYQAEMDEGAVLPDVSQAAEWE